MNGAFWNLRGIRKKGVAACLTDIIKTYKLDFIGLQETMKQDFNESFLRKFDPDMSFFWKWVPSYGKSGGILCGVRQETLEVSAVKTGKYLLQFNLWDKKKKM